MRLAASEQAQRYQRILAEYERGLSSRAVASKLGIGGSTVRNVINLYGVSRAVGRPRK